MCLAAMDEIDSLRQSFDSSFSIYEGHAKMGLEAISSLALENTDLSHLSLAKDATNRIHLNTSMPPQLELSRKARREEIELKSEPLIAIDEETAVTVKQKRKPTIANYVEKRTAGGNRASKMARLIINKDEDPHLRGISGSLEYLPKKTKSALSSRIPLSPKKVNSKAAKQR